MTAFSLRPVSTADMPIPGSDPWYAAPGDPALTAMTDFRERSSVTVQQSASIDAALDHMKHAGVRSAFVVHEQRRVVVGLITAYDIMGDKPVRHAQDQKTRRHDVRVQDIMVPLLDLRCADIRDIERATIGDVERVLDASGLTHLPVVESDAHGGTRLRGLLSAARIKRLLAR